MKKIIAGKKILIVEDEIAVTRLLSERLSKEGFMVSGAKDGAEGLKKAKKTHPDLIILDIIMPVMDGLTMLKELRKDKWGRHSQVIILTNLSDGEELATAVEHKVYDFLVKADWKLEDLIKKVKEKLK